MDLKTMAYESLRLLGNYLNHRTYEEITHGPSRQFGVNIAESQFNLPIDLALNQAIRQMAEEITVFDPIGCYQLSTDEWPNSWRATDLESHLSVRVRFSEMIFRIDAAFA